MKKASVSILKARLSQYLAAVKSGEEVVVTERGRPVARLIGMGVVGLPEGRVGKLVREGRLRPPVERGSLARPGEALPSDPEGRSLRLLIDARAEGR